jgi:hypothetical protein
MVRVKPTISAPINIKLATIPVATSRIRVGILNEPLGASGGDLPADRDEVMRIKGMDE